MYIDKYSHNDARKCDKLAQEIVDAIYDQLFHVLGDITNEEDITTTMYHECRYLDD